MEDSVVLDTSITRGLDYYTGVVFETFMCDIPEIGSVCSGGRYDNLTALYTKNRYAGVGASIGLDRMIAALDAVGKLPPAPAYAHTAICCRSEKNSGLYQALAARFREKGVSCDVFLEETPDEKVSKQFILAEKRGIRSLIIPGDNPINDRMVVRDIVSRKNSEEVLFEEAIKIIEEINGR
jgi:histidyl-tRNA synthetase